MWPILEIECLELWAGVWPFPKSLLKRVLEPSCIFSCIFTLKALEPLFTLKIGFVPLTHRNARCPAFLAVSFTTQNPLLAALLFKSVWILVTNWPEDFLPWKEFVFFMQLRDEWCWARGFVSWFPSDICYPLVGRCRIYYSQQQADLPNFSVFLPWAGEGDVLIFAPWEEWIGHEL